MASKHTTDRQIGDGRVNPRAGDAAARPLASRRPAAAAVEGLLAGNAEALTRAAIAHALDGDVSLLRLCADRLLPLRQERELRFTLPKLRSANDALAAIANIVQAVASGELTTAQARDLSSLVAAFVTTLAAQNYHQRLCELEAKTPDMEQS